jgi:extracellular elastinolytic metalloproteinase
MKLRLLSFLLLLGAAFQTNSFAQQRDPLETAFEFVKENPHQWDLSPADVAGMTLSDRYQTAHNGLTHLYFLQRHAGIEVHTAIMGIHVKNDGQVGYAVHRFVPGIASKINTTQPDISAREAIDFAARHVGVYHPTQLRILQQPAPNHFIFQGGTFAKSDITVKLVYQPLRREGNLRLAWHVTLDQIDSPDWWSIRVDALNGDILERNNWTTYCSFHQQPGHHHNDDCSHEAYAKSLQAAESAMLTDGASYRVFPLPAESPIHGTYQLVENPADPEASPFGWHDINGQPGPEYTITRGNNTWAYLDTANINASSNNEPNGGSNLVFDFPYDPNFEPNQMKEAAVVNLFYMSNMMHDINYAYGFNEAAGNFQVNNYGNGGVGNDPVRAEAQDGGGTNNANFATPPDGGMPRMQMFLWTSGNSTLLTVLEPEGISGGYESGAASFGNPITATPIIGSVVRAVDASSQPELACQTIVNAAQVAGKIAMIRRGECFFKQKVRNAQLAGAIAVIICNFEESLLGMGDVASVPNVTIPSVMLKNSACQLIRQALDNGEEVIVRLQEPQTSGPARIDGSFDNGIIAHEFGHGISNRLTGGPSQADCLQNGEQMGEGWSDFFTLIATAKPGDAGNIPRGIGNYATRSAPNGSGIRRLPYSTNPSINRQTFNDIIGTTAPHPLGEVWVGMVWDLYWALVDVYGWDEDLVNGTGGNNIAIRLVMDGMKLQNCLPGFVDGRDAIIAADIINYNGEHECLIWEVFARRGLGWSAQQGDNFDRNDGFEAFDTKPECIKELKIKKSLTSIINAGEEITATLTVTNHKEADASGVVVTDIIPNGATFINSSVTGNSDVTVNGNIVSFNVGTMASGDEFEITYRMSTSPNLKSVRQFYDDMEEGDGFWGRDALEGTDIWDIIEGPSTSGTQSWFVPSTVRENDQVLLFLEPVQVSGTQPVLRFNHQYGTEPGIDGGIVQFSSDGGNTWFRPEQLIFKNGYRGRIYYTAFAIPDVQAFWGNSNGFVDTYYDLSPYIGQELLIRFRFSTNPQPTTTPETGTGWHMDDFEIMDMFNYNSEACISSAQGDQNCSAAANKGTIVQPGLVSSTSDEVLAGKAMEVFPNPTFDFINVSFDLQQNGQVSLQLFSADGRLLKQQTQTLGAGTQLIPMSLTDLPKGIYLLRLNSDGKNAVEKIVKR